MQGPILIVEDSAPIRRLVDICLRGLGPPIVTAPDGRTALRLAEADNPALVVLDIGLPGIDGWEVLGEIRSHPALAPTPVLILTAHAEERDRFHTGDDRADAFMSKPFEPADLVATAGRLLAAGPRPAPTIGPRARRAAHE
jgi:DNA-binding response OmpR family regulator